jgi:uncharacterized metal-binding protein YceD (DUF177 family)
MIEFSRPFPVDTLRAGEIEQTIEASALERTALAARFAIPGIEALAATLTVRVNPLIAGRYEVEGQARAALSLTCSVSAEEYTHPIETVIRAVFVAGPVPAHTEDMAIDYEWDDPEPLEHGIIDLGELVAQHILLAIPAYPRKPDAGWAGPSDEDPEVSPVKESPFAVLQSLKEHKT